MPHCRTLSSQATNGETFQSSRKKKLPSKTVKALSQIDDFAAATSVAETVLVTAGSVSLPLLFGWSPLVLLTSLVLTASRHQALFVLAHDAAHGRLFSNRRLNDAVGQACGAAVGFSTLTYRVTHRLHHNHLYEHGRDPDIAIHGGYPRGAAYLSRKLLVDLSGWTAYKTYGYFFGYANQMTSTLDDTSPHLRRAGEVHR